MKFNGSTSTASFILDGIFNFLSINHIDFCASRFLEHLISSLDLNLFLILNMGALRSLLFTILAYGIAFVCEYSSTRNGFPFGFYTYIDTTRDQELWVSNVPFMDSLSFSFLIYLSYTFSLFLWAPLNRNGWNIKLGDISHIQHSFKVLASASLLSMLMDVIIDPVAFLGDRWFLGKIYFYS